MSEVKGRPALFFDLYRAGQVPESAIDNYVEAWHASGDEEDRPLSAFLGLTEDECAVWVMDGRTLPMLLAARQAGETLSVAVTRYLDMLREAANPVNRAAILALSHWVKKHAAD